MAISQLEASEDIFEKVRGRALAKEREVLMDTYTRDKLDLLSDLAEALDIEEEELPKFEIEVRLTLGKQVVSVSGFEVEEKDEDEDE